MLFLGKRDMYMLGEAFWYSVLTSWATLILHRTGVPSLPMPSHRWGWPAGEVCTLSRGAQPTHVLCIGGGGQPGMRVSGAR